MYLRAYPETTFGQATPQVFQCTVDAIILDDFVIGDYRLRPSHYEKLLAIREFAKLMKNAGKQMSVTLAGFTDNTGKERMNEGLSVSRAAEVQNFLERVGVTVRRAEGRGASNPRGDNRFESGRRKNRRVEITVCVLVPPSPGGVYHIKVADLMRQVGFEPRTLLAGPPGFAGVGEGLRRPPWRARAGLESPPARLTFFTLNQFGIGEWRLTDLQRSLVNRLAESIRASW